MNNIVFIIVFGTSVVLLLMAIASFLSMNEESSNKDRVFDKYRDLKLKKNKYRRSTK